ncbi:MAG: hypothetical protein AAF570_26520, partial [Bacteroidota bacterium]
MLHLFDHPIDEQNLDASFATVAAILFDHWALEVNGHRFRLSEVEFYYNDAADSFDCYAHRHSGHKHQGWRVHGAGIDLAISSAMRHGGILLRGMEAEDGEAYIDGPWKLISSVFGLLEPGPAENRWALRPYEWPKAESGGFVRGPRVGLHHRAEVDPAGAMRFAPWRMVRRPIRTKRDRHSLALQMHREGVAAEEIGAVLGVKARNLARYVEF